MTVLVVGCCWLVQDLQARPVLETTHKRGTEAATTLLRPADNGLVKSQPGQEGNILVGNPAFAQLSRLLSARSAVVVDASSGRLVYTLNPDEPRQPASTIKVLTGLIAIDSLRDYEMVPASRRAAGMPRSKIYLEPGRSYRAVDLVNAVLLTSANDASVALAERIAGNERAFARLMTGKARAMGARNTVLVNSSGLTAAGQQSTARDLALIFHQAMQQKEFAKRMASTTVNTSFGRTLSSKNRALWQIEGSEGGKTGFTRAARQTYVGKFKRGDHELIVSLMGSESMWDDVRRLVEFGFKQVGDSAMIASTPVDPAFVLLPGVYRSVAMSLLNDGPDSGQ